MKKKIAYVYTMICRVLLAIKGFPATQFQIQAEVMYDRSKNKAGSWIWILEIQVLKLHTA